MTKARRFANWLALRLWRMVKPPSGKGVRRVIILICLVVGLGRLGAYRFISTTHIPAQWYGSVLIILAGLLMWTTWQRRLSPFGRIVAALTAGVLAWLGADVLPNITSTLILFTIAWACIGEAAATHDH